MTIENHLTKLKKKHETLQGQIDAMQQGKLPDSLAIKDLKKKKLQLKQKMERLKSS